jgi:imidazolonepropionase-like amidohydrolase
MRATCDEAHRQGRRVCAHAVSATSIKNAVLAGVDTIEHGCLADAEALDLMAAHGTYPICTLLPYYNQAHLAQEKGYPDDVSGPSLSLMERYPEVIREALERDVAIGLGSDCGIWQLTPHGDNAAELTMLVELCGVAPLQAIALATSGGAAALDLSDVTGSVEVGKRADLLVVTGDPSRDVDLLRDPAHQRVVMKEGVVCHRRPTV